MRGTVGGVVFLLCTLAYWESDHTKLSQVAPLHDSLLMQYVLPKSVLWAVYFQGYMNRGGSLHTRLEILIKHSPLSPNEITWVRFLSLACIHWMIAQKGSVSKVCGGCCLRRPLCPVPDDSRKAPCLIRAHTLAHWEFQQYQAFALRIQVLGNSLLMPDQV